MEGFKWIDKIISWFVDKNISRVKKVIGGLILLTIIISSDLMFSISENIHETYKYDHLQKNLDVQKTLTQFSERDSARFEELNREFNEILNRKHYWHSLSLMKFEQLWHLQSFFFPPNEKRKPSTHNKPKPASENITNVPVNPIDQRSVFWMTLSSSYIFLVVGIMILFQLLKTLTEKNQKNGTNLVVGLIFMLLLTSFTTFLWTSLHFEIPVINEKKLWMNYLVNGIIQIVLLLIFVGAVRKKKKVETGYKASGRF